MSLLQMSFSGAILILAVLVIRGISINHLPKKTFLILWEIVLLKLIFPFSIPSALSLYSFIDQNTAISTFTKMPAGNGVPVTGAAPFELTGEIAKLSANHVSSVSLWSVIWLAGTILCTTFFTISYLRYRFEFQASLPVQNDFVKQWLREYQKKRHISVKQSDRIFAPLTYGIFKPVILMPKKTDWENTKQLQYIFFHEYVHICRYDTVTKLISTLALCIHWFNPLVWVMYFFFNRDIELACDEKVVRHFGEASKSYY